MSYSLYVNNLPPKITLTELIIYFQSDTKSGGGDVDSDACKLDGNKAVVVFEEKKDLAKVLQRKHEINGYKLEISDQPMKLFKPVPKKRTKLPDSHANEKPISEQKEKILANNEGAYLGKVRTVIVNGLNPDTTNETLSMFFESSRRSGGGEIEKLERCERDIAHVTYVRSEVALRVLKNDKLELDGYLLQLKEKQPELILPLDRKKLYVENIDVKTTRDSVSNYIELITRTDVCKVEFGDNRNALITLNEEPDMKKVLENKNNKPLEGAVLNISNPPVCNSLLITGLSKNTTKQAIEMYFENEKHGGGKIYGEVIYQKDKGEAVISFCDPVVIQTLSSKEQKLNRSILSLHHYYPFMKTCTEPSTKMIKLDANILDHVIKKLKNEFRDLFGIEIKEMLGENEDELTLPDGLQEGVFIKIQDYFNQFTVKEMPFSKKVIDNSEKDLSAMIKTVNTVNCTIKIDDELLSIKIVGPKEETTEIYGKLKNTLMNIEKGLNIVTEKFNLAEPKLELFLFHGIDDKLRNEFQVDVKVEQQQEIVIIKGTEKQVSLALKSALQEVSQITEDTIELSEPEKKFLLSGGLDIINSGMKAHGLRGMVFLSNSKAMRSKVLVFDGTKVEAIHSYLRNNMFEQLFSLDDDNITLLKSNKWEEFCENVAKKTSVHVHTCSSSPPKISLIGKKSEVDVTFKNLQEFMRRNTIVAERVDLGEGNGSYLAKYCCKDLKEIQKKFDEHLVRINIDDEGIINIDGTKDGVKEAKKQLKDIASNIARGKICFDNSRMQKHLESEQGKLSLDGIESNNKCLIRLTRHDGEISQKLPSTLPKSEQNKPTSKLLTSYLTQEKVSLKVFKADITKHRCDVIVNAANGDLQHIGGLAKCIVDVGGKEIQDECDAHVAKESPLFEGECFSGSPGKLPCKRLIHAVGPRWDSTKPDKVKRILQVTCIKALEEARNFRSIALPAIGSGVFGIPKDICADIMIQAVEEFSKKHSNCSLKEIDFVNNDDASCKAFVKKFSEIFAARSHLDESQSKNTRTKSGSFGSRFQVVQNTREVPANKSFIITKRNVKISVVVGDLSSYKADVLVNTTGQKFQLDSNPCSKALSNKAGPVLQAECDKIGKLHVGQVAVTRGGNLLCDEVYHVVCVQWENGQGEQILRQIIGNCLKKCHSHGKKSIAFPAIGTGTLGFPHDVTAKIFFEETKKFCQRVRNCNVNDVSFVVYHQDANSIQAYKNELKKQEEWSGSGSTGRIPVKLNDRWEREDLNSMPTSTTKSSRFGLARTSGDDEERVMCIQVGEDKDVEIVRGDITKETTDVIAHLGNSSLTLNSGVAMALARAGGKEIERECVDKASSTNVTTTVLTTAGRLDAKYVAHMVGPNDFSPHEIEKCINNCLVVVNRASCESVSFPAVGTGMLRLKPEDAATLLLRAIIRFLQSNSGTLRTVRVVLKDDHLVKAFQESFKQLSKDEEPGMLRKFINLFWKTESTLMNAKEIPPTNTKKLFLEIYAKDDATVNRTKEMIQKIMDSLKKKDKIEDENICKLSRRQFIEIQNLCEMNEIKVTIEKELNRIVVFGHIEDISKTNSEIYKILKQVGEEEKEREKAALHEDLAEIVSQGVQWFCVNPHNGDHHEYDKQTNAMIEKAYGKREKSVIFMIKNQRYEIVFDKMQESNLKTNEKIQVIRKDLKAEAFIPDYWDPQPRDTNGKELAVHLVQLNPGNRSHKDEYANVSAHFSQTANSQILQIQRVQNPSLFKLYMMKKQSLDEKSGSNEKFLFHGTRGDKTKLINESGLNRSYAGNTHGALYGRGVYFARDASMSVGYASSDAAGKRYMYFTRVALGQYTLGNQSMLVPPQKGLNSSDSYDSVVDNVANPSIFVLFSDYQYYPEYLITFC